MTTELKTIEQTVPHFLSLEIVDQPTLQEASTYLVSAKKDYKALKADMDSLLAPLKETAEGIKAKYDPRLKALKSVIDALTTKTTQYQTKLINAQREAQEKITAKVESGYIKPETAVDKLSSLGTVEKRVETEVGGMSFIATKCFEVTDLSLVPIEFHLPDEVNIRKAMKDGIELAGVKYWTEQRPRNSR